MNRFARIILPFAILATLAAPGSPRAEDANERLLIVNGSSGHVIYDDGRDDLFCVVRRRLAGYNDWGHPIYRRRMRCR